MWGAARHAILRDRGRWAELVHREDRAREGPALPLALAGETGVVDYRLVRPATGEVRWVRDTVPPRPCWRRRARPMASPLLLVIDDDKATATVLVRVLEDAGSCVAPGWKMGEYAPLEHE